MKKCFFISSGGACRSVCTVSHSRTCTAQPGWKGKKVPERRVGHGQHVGDHPRQQIMRLAEIINTSVYARRRNTCPRSRGSGCLSAQIPSIRDRKLTYRPPSGRRISTPRHKNDIYCLIYYLYFRRFRGYNMSSAREAMSVPSGAAT